MIFESLNSTGLELSQADLIRNFVLMKLEPKEQEDLYKRYCDPMEKIFGNLNESSLFDRFMRDYLTVKTGRIPKVKSVYTDFKEYLFQKQDFGIKDILSEVYQYSKYFAHLAFQTEKDIESYVFRRAICGVPTNSLNKTFATMSREMDKENYVESVQIVLVLKDSYRRFPGNDEFTRELKVKDVYNFRNRNYLLRKLENYLRKEVVDIESYTIEHIMPQNESLSEE